MNKGALPVRVEFVHAGMHTLQYECIWELRRQHSGEIGSPFPTGGLQSMNLGHQSSDCAQEPLHAKPFYFIFVHFLTASLLY